MNHEQELPADLDNLIAGLRIENINLKLEIKQKDRALAGMLFAFDDGVGEEWSAPVLDFARKLVKAKEFDASQQGERNQCDGCQAGIPVDENGSHRMGRAGGYPDLMHCQKERYEHPEQAEGAHVPDEVFEAEFMTWWEEEGKFCRSGGGDYERTFAFQAWRHLYPQLMAPRAALAQPSPAPELERPEVVAWALQRKRDGFVRATWHQKPSETQYEIAELDGDVIAPLYAAPSVSTWKAPEGFALVPIEPTVAMRMPWKTMRGYSWHSKYKAMLAAAAVQRGEL